jgi:ribosomal protein S18 acetylase RimI-like enzyme
MEMRPLQASDEKSLRALYRVVTRDLRRSGVDQWDWAYPNRFTIRADVKSGRAFGISENGTVIGAVVVNDQWSRKYASIEWTDREGRPAAIHRLAVRPDFQGKGLGRQLLQFAERVAQDEGYTSIRLDVYSGNPGAVTMYQRHGYEHRGEVRYPMRKRPYFCYEKVLK